MNRPIDHLHSPSSVLAALADLGEHPKHHLGQNFLFDGHLAAEFAASLRIQPGDPVIEIGAGLGHLTAALLDAGARVLAIEKDPILAESLMDRLDTPQSLTVMDGDILDLAPGDLCRWAGHSTFIVTGNLPYYCSTPILTKLYEEWLGNWRRAGFLLQEEVVDRVVSPPGSKVYGRLSVLAQIFSTPSKIRKVPPQVFVPKPEVTSAWCVLDPIEPPPDITPHQIAHLTGICFSERRKTLFNNLRRSLGKENAEKILDISGLNGAQRAECLTPEQFILLWRAAEGLLDEVHHD